MAPTDAVTRTPIYPMALFAHYTCPSSFQFDGDVRTYVVARSRGMGARSPMWTTLFLPLQHMDTPRYSRRRGLYAYVAIA